LVVIATLVVLSVLGQLASRLLPDFPFRDAISNLFYVDFEQSIPTLFSVVMWLLAALLFGVIAHACRQRSRPYRRHWAVLCAISIVLAIDEHASLHKQASIRIRTFLDIRSGPLFWAWVVPALIAVSVLGIAFLRFLRHLPRTSRLQLCTAAGMFVVGAAGFEMVAGWYESNYGSGDMIYVSMATIEETLEMVAVAIVLCALLRYIAFELPDAVWRLLVVAEDHFPPVAVGGHQVSSRRA
jgi:hypothetical protein